MKNKNCLQPAKVVQCEEAGFDTQTRSFENVDNRRAVVINRNDRLTQIRVGINLATPAICAASHTESSEECADLRNQVRRHHDALLEQRKNANHETTAVLEDACEFIATRRFREEAGNALEPPNAKPFLFRLQS